MEVKSAPPERKAVAFKNNPNRKTIGSFGSLLTMRKSVSNEDSSSFISTTRANRGSISIEAIKTGLLYKRGGGKRSDAWKRRYFVLTGQSLYYYKSEKEKRPKGVIAPLKEFVVEDDANDVKTGQFQFRLAPKNNPLGRVYKIYAKKEEEKEDWMFVLRAATAGDNQNKTSVEIEAKLRRNKFDIPDTDLEWKVSDILGKGASGVVKRGIWQKTTEVAVKALNNLPEFTDSEEMIGFYKEIETVSQLRHPNIVTMFGFCKKDGYICLVTEYIKGGNLSESIHNPSVRIDLGLKLALLSSICRGMIFLHSKKVIHRDLKPQNILVENLDDAKVKVCDFGLSTITNKQQGQGESEVENPMATTKAFGSPAYAAPELPTESHTQRVDVFSFAVIMWELYTRTKPWMDSTITHAWQIAERVASGQRLAIPPGCIIASLITRCWAQNPAERPEFTQIYEDLERLRAMIPETPAELKITDNSFNNVESIPQVIDTKVNSMDSFTLQNSPELQLLEAFGERLYITWDDFVRAVQTVFTQSTKQTIDKLKFVLGNSDTVDKQYFKTFLEWFHPLSKSDFYENNSEVIPTQTNGYDLEMIADIVGPNWFFGFMTAAQAKDILIRKPYGSFIFRFSSNAGCYALSVNYGQVGHWRIITEKNGSGPPLFKIDGRLYRSLYHVIEVHSIGGEPLVVKGSTTVKTCFLREPCDRYVNTHVKQAETLYETFG